jgi:hypothetical protein
MQSSIAIRENCRQNPPTFLFASIAGPFGFPRTAKNSAAMRLIATLRRSAEKPLKKKKKTL